MKALVNSGQDSSHIVASIVVIEEFTLESDDLNQRCIRREKCKIKFDSYRFQEVHVGTVDQLQDDVGSHDYNPRSEEAAAVLNKKRIYFRMRNNTYIA